MELTFSSVETSAKRREWASLTGADFAKLDRERTVVVVSSSPLEVHGPHLPVMADCLESEAIAVRGMELLAERHPEIEYLHLPPVYVASDVLPQRGSLMFRPRTVRRVVEDLGRSLAKQGFRHIWVSGFHAGPRHFLPVEMACHDTNRRYGTAMVSVFSLLLSRVTGGRTDGVAVFGHLPGVSRDDLDGDSHGGLIETSLLLHLARSLVDPSFCQLEPNSLPLKLEREGRAPLYAGERPTLWELVRGFREKLRYYGQETYAGKPGQGSAELGEQMLEVLAQHTADALGELWTGQLDPQQCHSPLWPVRWLFMNRPIGWAANRVMGYHKRVF